MQVRNLHRRMVKAGYSSACFSFAISVSRSETRSEALIVTRVGDQLHAQALSFRQAAHPVSCLMMHGHRIMRSSFRRRLKASLRISRAFQATLKGNAANDSNLRVIILGPLKSPNVNFSSVVFSFWTSTLDIVELALDRSFIRCARIDGKLNMKKRISVFEKFRDDNNVAVLLLSLSCGAVG
jgi:hypothetical protein